MAVTARSAMKLRMSGMSCAHIIITTPAAIMLLPPKRWQSAQVSSFFTL